ncbi:MAG: 5-formyltetrahydrofolate cyclo-ligase [Chroococcidiopsidaceae cyanobacterium CP_BM_RX_35]|nr:5-formyltetrahydrofolate cyclo-ligase [Chroococcidiopsidaceae cyanobacterium CP_BM_RX_35]
MSKVELRRTLLKRRLSLSKTEWRQKSDRIASHLQASPLFAKSQTILAYFSFRQEPDLSSLFSDSHRRWGFPRCAGDTLSWHIWTSAEFHLWQRGAYGILEPQPTVTTLEPDEVDLMLVPAIACDYRGYRLGYGGGYYDRLLSSALWASKPTIAIVFEFAYLQHLPIDSWDKPLQGVCTETGLLTFGSNSACNFEI